MTMHRELELRRAQIRKLIHSERKGEIEIVEIVDHFPVVQKHQESTSLFLDAFIGFAEFELPVRECLGVVQTLPVLDVFTLPCSVESRHCPNSQRHSNQVGHVSIYVNV